MKILIPADKDWKRSTLYSYISAIFFLTTLLGKPPTPGYAPHMYSYNMRFFFPLMMMSLGFGIAGFVNYLNIKKKQTYGFGYRLIPILFLAPLVLAILLFVFNLIWSIIAIINN